MSKDRKESPQSAQMPVAQEDDSGKAKKALEVKKSRSKLKHDTNELWPTTHLIIGTVIGASAIALMHYFLLKKVDSQVQGNIVSFSEDIGVSWNLIASISFFYLYSLLILAIARNGVHAKENASYILDEKSRPVLALSISVGGSALFLNFLQLILPEKATFAPNLSNFLMTLFAFLGAWTAFTITVKVVSETRYIRAAMDGNPIYNNIVEIAKTLIAPHIFSEKRIKIVLHADKPWIDDQRSLPSDFDENKPLWFRIFVKPGDHPLGYSLKDVQDAFKRTNNIEDSIVTIERGTYDKPGEPLAFVRGEDFSLAINGAYAREVYYELMYGAVGKYCARFSFYTARIDHKATVLEAAHETTHKKTDCLLVTKNSKAYGYICRQELLNLLAK